MTWLFGFLAKSALMQSPIGAVLRAIPRWAWLVAAAFALIWLGGRWHGHKVRAFGNERYAAGRASMKADIAALQDKLNAANATIAAEIRSKNDAKAVAIRADAGAVLMRGPGKAACPAVISARAGGSVAASGPGAASVDQMLGGERVDVIGLPFAGAVAGAEQADLNRAENVSWREWYRRLVDQWGKAKRLTE